MKHAVPTGDLITGRVQAGSREVVLAELRGRGLSPVRVSESRAPLFQRRVGTSALSSMFRGLSDLVASGVPLLRSLKLISKGRAHQTLSTVLADIADQVADGTTMANAMASHTNAFGPVHVAMVRAGEQGGFLAEVLVDLADLLERQATLRSRVIGNLVYPTILVVTGVGAVIFALVAFVPKFKPFFARIEVPAATRVLLALSDFVVGWWPLLLVAFVVVGRDYLFDSGSSCDAARDRCHDLADTHCELAYSGSVNGTVWTALWHAARKWC